MLLTYPLTPVPYSLATADGFFTKTDKSKALNYFSKDVPDSVLLPPQDTLTVLDGNATFYWRKNVPDSFKMICKSVFDMTGKNDVIFSTDSYFPNSVKSMERKRRGCTEKLILKGENTKKPRNWKAFLANDENKQQFSQLLVKEWSKDEYAKHLQGRKVILISEGTAHLLTSEDGVHTTKVIVDRLNSSQEETDTRIILYCQYAEEEGYRYCKVRSPDTDVFFILLYYAHVFEKLTLLFDTGTGNNRRLLDITELSSGFNPNVRAAVMAVHAFSGSDTTSAFKGI